MSVVESSTQSMLGVHGWIHLIMVIATALLLKKYVEIHGFHMTAQKSKCYFAMIKEHYTCTNLTFAGFLRKKELLNETLLDNLTVRVKF